MDIWLWGEAAAHVKHQVLIYLDYHLIQVIYGDQIPNSPVILCPSIQICFESALAYSLADKTS